MTYSELLQSHTQRLQAFFVLMAFFIISIVPAGLVSANSASAVTYLQAQSDAPWVTLALAAAGESPDASYLQTFSGTTALDYTTPILALTSLGLDPRSYPDTDLVAALLSFHTDSQIGDTSTVNDDIFGILALLSAGESAGSAAITDAQAEILDSQNADGGWGFAIGGTSDTNMTAAAIVALKAVGIANSDTAITDAKDYLVAAQNPDGGFPYDPNSAWGTDSDASSDAWVLWAINSLGENPSDWAAESGNPLTHLLSLQHSDGYFEFQPQGGENGFTPTTTAHALLALVGAVLPTQIVEPAPQVTVDYRIEGATGQICTGSVATQTALSLIEDVADTCDFEYTITNTAYGPYLSQLNGDVAEGLFGWMYAVDYMAPSVGAADYDLEAGDQVLWYFAEFGDQLTRISLDESEIDSGDEATVIIEYYDGDSWEPLDGATVHAGTKTEISDSDGEATFDLSDGSYQIWGEKDGFVRSSRLLLTVGELVENDISLSVTIGGSGVDPEEESSSTIAFIVDVDNLNFGELDPGDDHTEDVEVTNQGSVDIQLGATVGGDDVFRNYLELDSTPWRSFSTEIDSGGSDDVSVGLDIPSDYRGTGAKSGTLIFWATAAQD